MDSRDVLDSTYYDREYFDGGKGYCCYNNALHFEQTALDIIRLFEPSSVLEIGCAKGFLVKALRENGITAYGIDISEYAIACAPEEIQDYLFEYDITSGKQVEFPQVDLIVSFDTLEHIPKNKLGPVKDFFTKQADRFYIQVGTLNTPDWQHDPSHINMRRIEWWEQWLPQAYWRESK